MLLEVMLEFGFLCRLLDGLFAQSCAILSNHKNLSLGDKEPTQLQLLLSLCELNDRFAVTSVDGKGATC